MLAENISEQDDLRGGVTPWSRPVSTIPRKTVESDFSCDALIVGGGITGAMMAAKLAADGHDVCLVDRERPGLGSTAASTAMLLWEIDKSLTDLTDIYGFEKAADIYRRSFRATQKLCQTLNVLPGGCNFAPRHSLYLAAEDIGHQQLRTEFDLRERADVPGHYLDHRGLLQQFGMTREAALVSPGSAEADPRLMVHSFLRLAGARGIQIFDAEAKAYSGGTKTGAVELDGGHAIEARHIVLATGYALPEIVTSDLHQVTSSWAIAMQPQDAEALWPNRALIWEASKNYVYARTTWDNRIVIGGGDDNQVSSQDHRDRLMPDKTAILRQKLEALWPQAAGDVQCAWSGAFGITRDGLPLIGKVPGYPSFYAAYGYGGNGITFSYLAAEIVSAMIRNERRGWFDYFAIDRAL